MSCDTDSPTEFKQMPTEILTWLIDWTKRGLPVGVTIVSAVFAPYAGDSSYTITNVNAQSPYTALTLTGGIPDATSLPTILATANLSDGEKLQCVVPYRCISMRKI